MDLGESGTRRFFMQITIDEKARKKAITAAGIGNFVEWFDFVLYAQFAAIIAIHFFPSENPTSGLLATFAVFCFRFFCSTYWWNNFWALWR